LIENGIQLRKNNSDHRFTKHESLLNQLYEFYFNLYDTRIEFDKDIWDIRNIPGSRIDYTKAEYYLKFNEIPSKFINLVKRYIKFRISYLSHGQCRTDIKAIKVFFLFINEKKPSWSDLRLLTRKDMEEYLFWYRKYTNEKKVAQTFYLITLRTFLDTIQRLDYEESPQKPITTILFKEDIPRYLKTSENSIKYIPEGVIKQIEDNLENLSPPRYIPIVILLRASGWRISDVLSLKYDSCLEKTEQGWYLCGDIKKTQVLNHRIPITEEVEVVIKAVIEKITQGSTGENNPQKFLFAELSGPRKGLPPVCSSISKSLNRYAKKYNITDDDGNLFHIRNHAFRHTKGIELINNGMNLLHVQKWMAHASPEMTLTYAKILDTTMRKSWEEATKQGLFRIDDIGKIKKIDISDIENEDVIEWEYIRHNLDAVRMPLGYCMKPKKQECHTQLNPCLTCRNLCTTPDFIPQFEMEIQETKTIIERGKFQNRSVWIDKNQVLLERYEVILAVLKKGEIHHKCEKKGREYTREERTNG
jgi:integrase